MRPETTQIAIRAAEAGLFEKLEFHWLDYTGTKA